VKEQVIIATDPDDVVLDGFRILLADVTPEQSQVISTNLLSIPLSQRVILYHWNTGNSINWLIDKKHKSNLIIFNADSYNDLITGYLSAQKNSYYFGNLKLLADANNFRIFGQEDCFELLITQLNKNG
jgi:hypothetical protein